MRLTRSTQTVVVGALSEPKLARLSKTLSNLKSIGARFFDTSSRHHNVRTSAVHRDVSTNGSLTSIVVRKSRERQRLLSLSTSRGLSRMRCLPCSSRNYRACPSMLSLQSSHSTPKSQRMKSLCGRKGQSEHGNVSLVVGLRSMHRQNGSIKENLTVTSYFPI